MPAHAQPGDRLVVLVGGNVPFVLRRVKHDWDTVREEEIKEQQADTPVVAVESLTSSSIPTAPAQHASMAAEDDGWDEGVVNGPAYPGTSRGPQYPLIWHQQLVEGQISEEAGVAVQVEFFVPQKMPGSESYDPTFEVVGTAYVHGVMNGEVKRAYEKRCATLQMYLLV